MSFFSLPNGKKFDLSYIKAGIKIDNNSEFLKKYDANNNSIFDEAEIETFKEDIIPYISDGGLDKRETVYWYAKLFGFSAEALKAHNAQMGRDNSDVANIVEEALLDLTKSAAEAECVAYLKQSGVNITMDMLTRDNGIITELYDRLKEAWGDTLSPSYIYNMIFSEILSNQFLEDAHNGKLTKNEYIERKITATKAILMHRMMGEYFEKEFADVDIPKEQLEYAISKYFDLRLYNMVEQAATNYDQSQGSSFDSISWSINNFVERLLQDEELEKKFFKNVSCSVIQDISEFVSKSNQMTLERKNIDLSQLYVVPNISYSEDEFLSFEQVFKLEKGKDFDVEAYQEFMTAKSEMERIMGPYNKMSGMLEQTDQMLDAVRRLIASNPHSNAYDNMIDAMGKKDAVNASTVEAIENICDLFMEYYAGDSELAANDLNKIIQSKKINGLMVTISSEGKLNIGFKEGVLETYSDKMYAVTQLLEEFQKEIKSRFELILGGKSLDSYIEKYNSTRTKALGKMPADQFVDMYKADNGTVIQRCTGMVKTTGMVMILVGGVLCVTPAAGAGAALTGVGGKLAIGGMVTDYALQYTEALTRDEISEEELENISKYFVMDAGGFIIGFKAGQMGNKVFAKLLDKKLGEVLKQEITTGNRIKALKTVLKNKDYLKSFMKASGAKIGTDFLISYVGDLVMSGVLDTEEDYLTLLKANLLGIVVGTSGDLANIGHLTVKQKRYHELTQKQNSSILNDAEVKELAQLKKELSVTNKPDMGLTEKPDEATTNPEYTRVGDIPIKDADITKLPLEYKGKDVKVETTRDDHNKCTIENKSVDGCLVQTVKTFDNGKIEVSNYYNGKLKSYFCKPEIGSIEIMHYNTDGKIAFYSLADSNGIFEAYKFIYDEHGNCTRKEEEHRYHKAVSKANSEKEVSYTTKQITEFKYDSNNNRIEEKCTDNDGNVKIKTCSYDKNNKITKEVNTRNGEVTSTVEYFYDKSGKESKIISTNEYGVQVNHLTSEGAKEYAAELKARAKSIENENLRNVILKEIERLDLENIDKDKFENIDNALLLYNKLKYKLDTIENESLRDVILKEIEKSDLENIRHKFRSIDDALSLYNNLKYKLDAVTDPEIVKLVNEELNSEIETGVEKLGRKLSQLEKLIDSYNEMDGVYTRTNGSYSLNLRTFIYNNLAKEILPKNLSKSVYDEFIKVIKNILEQSGEIRSADELKQKIKSIDLKKTIKEIKKQIQNSGRELTDADKKRLEDLDIILQNINHKTNNQIKNYLNEFTDETLLKDFEEDLRIGSLVNYCKEYPDSKLGTELYNRYLEDLDVNPEYKKRIAEINNKYNIKIFLSKADISENTLKFIETELAEWDRVGANHVKYPPTLDFLRAKTDYFDETSAYGHGRSAGFCESNGAISVDGNNTGKIEWALRHEMTHTNDLTRQGFSKAVSFDDIKANKKYWNEFQNAGINTSHIDYAYNNAAEFIAVASEGDFSKYSAEFKEVLVSLGMPRWELDMKPNKYRNGKSSSTKTDVGPSKPENMNYSPANETPTVKEESRIGLDSEKPNAVNKPSNVKSGNVENVRIIDELDQYIQGITEHGIEYKPEFLDSASPLFKEFFEYYKNSREKLPKGFKLKTPDKLNLLKDIENFILTKSEIATREDYTRIADEIASLMPAYIKEKYPKIRPEIADNADKIYRWKAAMAGQKQSNTPDANGKYLVTNDKFFDVKARDEAVKEFTAFLEEMTGKKVLVGNTVRFDEFINMLGAFNNPDAYKDVDYIILGHGTGSSLVTDASDPMAWRFKGEDSSQPVWDYIEDNVPKGKKALLLVCEHDGLTPEARRSMPEMYDDNGVYMEGIGEPANGMAGNPAKVVVSGNKHIVGTVESTRKSGGGSLIIGYGGDVTVKNFSINNISKKIDLNKDSYTTYTDKNGNVIYKVVATATQNPRNGGWDYTYNVYKVDENGMIIEELNGVKDKEIKKVFGKLRNEQIHDNSGADNSGYAYIGLPFFKKVFGKMFEETDMRVELPARQEGNLESAPPTTRMDYSRHSSEITHMIDEACRELNYDRESFYNLFLNGVESNSIIFSNKENLKAYLEHCNNMSYLNAKNGGRLFVRQYYNFQTGQVDTCNDFDLIRDVAELLITSPEMHAQLGDRAIVEFMDGNIDEFQFRSLVYNLKNGYVSPGTIDVAYSSGRTLRVEDLVDSQMPDRYMSKMRASVLKNIKDTYPNLQFRISELQKELGDDLYKIRWELLQNHISDTNTVFDFVADAKNLACLKNTRLTAEHFYIRIQGYGKNEVWGNDISEIANTAAAMLEGRTPFDEVMSYVAYAYRELDAKITPVSNDNYKLQASGMLRCARDGYMYDESHVNRFSYTPFDRNGRYGQYYYDRFLQCTRANELRNPYPNMIDLTRIDDAFEFGIKPNEFDPNNPKHICKQDAAGVYHYYEIGPAMVHPKGQNAGNALDLVNSIQSMLMDKYHGKTITQADLDDINENIGEIHWILSHSMPWGRGSAGISDAYVKALYKSLGIQLSPPRQGVSFDLEAFCTELEDYRKNYKYLYETEPRYVL